MLVAALTLAFGLFAFWMALRVRRAIRATRHWQTVPGEILERDVGRMSSVRASYYPIVKYAYQVGGTSYTGDTVYIIGRYGGTANAIRTLVNTLPEPIPVHYDPSDPARSYLLRNPSWILIVIFLFAIGATFVGLIRLLALLP